MWWRISIFPFTRPCWLRAGQSVSTLFCVFCVVCAIPTTAHGRPSGLRWGPQASLLAPGHHRHQPRVLCPQSTGTQWPSSVRGHTRTQGQKKRTRIGVRMEKPWNILKTYLCLLITIIPIKNQNLGHLLNSQGNFGLVSVGTIYS